MILSCALLCVSMASAMAPESVLLHDFCDTSAWRLHQDGGRGVATVRDSSGMRITYTDAPPHWGNLVAACKVPRRAVGLAVRLTKHHASPRAAMHIWLLEPDGDAWLLEVRSGSDGFGRWKAGRQSLLMPIGAFQFQSRGPGSRNMPSCDRILIGCNYGDLDVTMERMEWVMAQEPQRDLPDPEPVKIVQGRLGSVGILRMTGALPLGGLPTHQPERLAAVLESAGFGVTLLSPSQMRAEGALSRNVLDAVILPYGPLFPEECRDAFIRYLKGGGSFLSADGYAFDRLIRRSRSGWTDTLSAVTAEQTSSELAIASGAMNTRHGRQGDAMWFGPEQIGVFDPCFPLTNCVSARASAWYRAVGGRDIVYRWTRGVTGYASCALTGDNNPVFPPTYRRWIPLLEGKDASGRDRGAVLALVRNYAGAFRGSSWAFSGLTDGTDILLRDASKRALLVDVVRRLVEGVFLHGLATEYPLYKAGETVTARVKAACFGRSDFSGTLTFRFSTGERRSLSVRLRAGEEATLSVEVPARSVRTGYVPFAARLVGASGVVDEIRSGFCVENKAVVASGPKVEWRGNYFTLNGRPQIILGSNQTGMMFFAEGEGPATWERDFAMMARAGLRVLRILHFSPFAANGYQGQAANSPADLVNRPERLCRQMDAIVQTAQRHGIVVFLTLHDWMPVGLTDSDLQHQREWNRFWAARYRDVPGIIYDVQNEPSVDVPDRPDIVALWNGWLRGRYGTDEELRRVWHVSPPEAAMPLVPLSGGPERWENVRAADRKRFEEYLLNRWAEANVKGVKEGDPDALVCIGYLPSMSPADKVLGVKHTDFSNMHYYGPVDGLPMELALIDRRAYGKGLTLGEFGAMEAHARRNAGADGMPVEASVERFAHTVHAAVGLGAAMICNWSLKEMDQMVFPWGLYQRNTPAAKPWAETYGAMARALEAFEPEYRAPETFILIPDAHRIGPRYEELHAAIRRSVGTLLDLNVPFGMLNEEDFGTPPASARVIVWPIPYCPNDRTFDAVRRWVHEGGTLYLSGSVAFDDSRRPNRAGRMVALGLTGGLTAPCEPWTVSPLQRTSVGKGHVVYSPDPVELRDSAQTPSVYSEALSAAGVRPIPVRTNGGRVRAQLLHGRRGTALYVFERMDDGDHPVRAWVENTSVAITLGRRACSFVLVDERGKTRRL